MNSVLILAMLVGNITYPAKIRDRFASTTPPYREQNLVDNVPVETGKIVVRVEVDSPDWGVTGEIEHQDPNAPAPLVVPSNTNSDLGTTTGANHLWELTWWNYPNATAQNGLTILRIKLQKQGASETYEYSIVVSNATVPAPSKPTPSVPPPKK